MRQYLLFLGELKKLLKATISFVISVRLSVLPFARTDEWIFIKFNILCIFLKSIIKIQVSLKYDNNNRYIYYNISPNNRTFTIISQRITGTVTIISHRITGTFIIISHRITGTFTIISHRITCTFTISHQITGTFTIISHRITDTFTIISYRITGTFTVISHRITDKFTIISHRITGTFTTISRRIFLGMKDVSDKSCKENQNTFHFQ